MNTRSGLIRSVGGTAALLAMAGTLAQAAPLTSATVVETKNEVLYKSATGNERPAKVADVVEGADVLRTGESSLAEVKFTDDTLTRLGSKTIFTFTANTREFHPGRGTTLIFMPKGHGGGRIVTAAVTAAIEGTTVIVQELDEPPLPGQNAPRVLSKVIFLEGTGQITKNNQAPGCPVNHRRIGPGQMIAQFVDDPCLTEVRDIDLGLLVKTSKIVNGFGEPLPSQPQIAAAIAKQTQQRQSGLLFPPLNSSVIYSPNPQPGSQGLSDAPMNNPSAVQGTRTSLGDGFYLFSRQEPGSVPIQGGGGFLWHQ